MVGAKRRNERVSSNWAISAGEWTSELIGTWDAAQDLVAHAVALSHPKPGWAVLMFPDASAEHSSRGARPRRFSRGHDARASGFSEWNLQGSYQRWATVDQGFAIVTTLKRLDYSLWNGVHIYTDNSNLAYIFDPEACVSSVAKTTTPRLDQWKAVLGQYCYTSCT